ncbi:MAG: gamma-glutamyltransferase family protein [Rhodospirillaceae bacterium]|nr:gamma-glutamyltransferase family protein [Rhodospirillaceae bacterium]
MKTKNILSNVKRQCTIKNFIISSLLMSICNCSLFKTIGIVEHAQDFSGMVASDEPNATMIGREIISAGGNSADAIVAMSLALSVTLPSRASLGAGGVCLIYNHNKNTVETLDFIAPPPRQIFAETDRPTALLALPRGLFALSAKYGHLHWKELVIPAELLARRGVPMSRVLSNQLRLVAMPLMTNSEMRRIFTKTNGQLLTEGDLLIQTDLGASLARLRINGVGELYNGNWCRKIVIDTNISGGSLSESEMRDFIPQWRDSVTVPYDNDVAYFTPLAGGLLEAQWWNLLMNGDNTYAATSVEVRSHLLAEILSRGLADRQQWLASNGQIKDIDDILSKTHLAKIMTNYTPDLHQKSSSIEIPPSSAINGTGLVALDRNGSAVACTIGLNNSFGVGRIIPHTGILLAAANWVADRGPFDMGPMLVINRNYKEFRYAIASGGGPAAPSSLIQTALASLVEGNSLTEAISTKRMFSIPFPDVIFLEEQSTDQLKIRGHQLEKTSLPSRINVIQCSSDKILSKLRCAVASDPRGSGLALIAEERNNIHR